MVNITQKQNDIVSIVNPLYLQKAENQCRRDQVINPQNLEVDKRMLTLPLESNYFGIHQGTIQTKIYY